MAHGAAKLPVPRYSVMPPSRDIEGDIEPMAMYAGQGVGLVNNTGPAAIIVSKLVQDAEDLLRRK